MGTGDHSMRKYDEELEAMRSRVLQMGGLVESQVCLALDAFESANVEQAQQAIDADRRVNELELELDQMVNHVIARRQPTAGDLRKIMGIAKATTDIERIGDEARKIARAAKWLREKDGQARVNRPRSSIRTCSRWPTKSSVTVAGRIRSNPPSWPRSARSRRGTTAKPPEVTVRS